jgi:hypothetical protein
MIDESAQKNMPSNQQKMQEMPAEAAPAINSQKIF